MIPKTALFFHLVAMWCAIHRLTTRVSAFSSHSTASRLHRPSGVALRLSTTTPAAPLAVVPRVKACDATDATEGPVLVKGWVRTLRKQKEVAFVQINDGSNLGGIQCVVPLSEIDEETKKGRCLNIQPGMESSYVLMLADITFVLSPIRARQSFHRLRCGRRRSTCQVTRRKASRRSVRQ